MDYFHDIGKLSFDFDMLAEEKKLFLSSDIDNDISKAINLNNNNNSISNPIPIKTEIKSLRKDEAAFKLNELGDSKKRIEFPAFNSGSNKMIIMNSSCEKHISGASPESIQKMETEPLIKEEILVPQSKTSMKIFFINNLGKTNSHNLNNLDKPLNGNETKGKVKFKDKNKIYAKNSRDKKKLYIKSLEKELIKKTQALEELNLKYKNLQLFFELGINYNENSTSNSNLFDRILKQLIFNILDTSKINEIAHHYQYMESLLKQASDLYLEKINEIVLPLQNRLLLFCAKESLSVFKDITFKKKSKSIYDNMETFFDNLLKKLEINENEKLNLSRSKLNLINYYFSFSEKYFQLIESKNQLIEEGLQLSKYVEEQVFRKLKINQVQEFIRESLVISNKQEFSLNGCFFDSIINNPSISEEDDTLLIRTKKLKL